MPRFLFCAVLFLLGLANLLLLPPYQAADESAHFYRAFKLAEGESWIGWRHIQDSWFPTFFVKATEPPFVPLQFKWAEQPSSYYNSAKVLAWVQQAPQPADRTSAYRQLLARGQAQLKNWGEAIKKWMKTGSTQGAKWQDGPSPDYSAAEPRLYGSGWAGAGVYPPVAHLPQAVGVFIGKWLPLPYGALLYLARLFNLLAFVSMVGLAMAWAPPLATVLFGLALTPMVLFQAGSASADTATFGLTLLTLALTGRILMQGPALRWNRYEGLAFTLCALVALCKFSYVLLPALPLLAYRVSARWPWRTVAKPALVWLGIVALSLYYATWGGGSQLSANNANASQQLAWLTGHLPEFLGVIARTAQQQGRYYLESLMGWIGWGHASPLPFALQIAYMALTMMLAVLGSARLWQARYPSVGAAASWVLSSTAWMVGIASVGMIYLALYMAWSAVGAPEVNGVQGRYFLPVWMCLPLLLLPLGVGLARVSPYAMARVPVSALNALGALSLTGLSAYATATIYWGFYR